jgi:hypothetical protein
VEEPPQAGAGRSIHRCQVLMMDLWGTLVLGMAMGVVLSTAIGAGTMAMKTTNPNFRRRCIGAVIQSVVLFGLGFFMWLTQVGLIF